MLQRFRIVSGKAVTQALPEQPGEVIIELPFDARLLQQQSFMHAGTLATIADSACGYAVLTLVESAHDVVAVEFKINFLRPALGERFRAGAGRSSTAVR